MSRLPFLLLLLSFFSPLLFVPPPIKFNTGGWRRKGYFEVLTVLIPILFETKVRFTGPLSYLDRKDGDVGSEEESLLGTYGGFFSEYIL